MCLQVKSISTVRTTVQRGIFILAAAVLCALPVQAQSERSDDHKSGRRYFAAPAAPADAFCRGFSLSQPDKVVCADRALLEKHLRVDRLERSLEYLAGLPRSLWLWEMHRVWLRDRAKCVGPEVAACLDGLYDSRIQEFGVATVIEEQSKH